MSLPSTPTPDVPQYCKLRVESGAVKDTSGNAIVLHGATLPSLAEMEASARKPEDRLRELAAAGARVVRLQVEERDMTPTFVPAAVSPFVDQANALGMLVILAYQNDVALTANAQGDNAEAWMRLAVQYLRNAPGVWFEPYSNRANTPKWQGLNQRVVDIARGFRADNVIVINEPTWLQASDSDVSGGNIIYGLSALDGRPAQVAPAVVVSDDLAALQVAQAAGAWAISTDEAVTDELSALWKTSVACR